MEGMDGERGARGGQRVEGVGTAPPKQGRRPRAGARRAYAKSSGTAALLALDAFLADLASTPRV